jgi:TRAP-type mannitol/chloroaromatic compound transport system permease large subunit
MLITVPLVLPSMIGFGIDLIWFGIVTVVAVEIGLLTPPFGISVFVIKSTLDDQRVTLNEIFAGALPFAAIMLVVLLILIAFPGISTVLVR